MKVAVGLRRVAAGKRTSGRRAAQIAYRERAGYSQEKLAEIIECSTIFISYIERGVKSPGLDKLMKIANALDVSVDILLGKDLASYNTERLKDIEQQLKKLPEQEQLKILDMIDSIISIELLHHNKQKG